MTSDDNLKLQSYANPDYTFNDCIMTWKCVVW